MIMLSKARTNREIALTTLRARQNAVFQSRRPR